MSVIAPSCWPASRETSLCICFSCFPTLLLLLYKPVIDTSSSLASHEQAQVEILGRSLASSGESSGYSFSYLLDWLSIYTASGGPLGTGHCCLGGTPLHRSLEAPITASGRKDRRLSFLVISQTPFTRHFRLRRRTVVLSAVGTIV